MNTTAENGFLPAMTEQQLIDISKREAARHAATLFQVTGDNGMTEDAIADLAQAFVLGALEALKKNEEGKAIRTLQWNYGRGYILKRLHEIINDINEAKTPIDTSGGAFTKDENEDATGYAPEADTAEPIDTFTNADDKAAALAAFNKLPDDFKTVIQLRLIEGKSFAIISRALDIAEVTARVYYMRGLAKLRELYRAA